MAYQKRILFSEAEIWDRSPRSESMSSIGRVFYRGSTLNKWITAHRDTDVVSKEDLDFAKENDRLRPGSWSIPGEPTKASGSKRGVLIRNVTGRRKPLALQDTESIEKPPIS